jgi:Protein of unknown function (DUF3606)
MDDLSPIGWKRRLGPIDVGNPRDVMYWAGLWGLADQELFDAVAAVGSDPADVAAHIGQPLRR